jgi:hypothetical protein
VADWEERQACGRKRHLVFECVWTRYRCLMNCCDVLCASVHCFDMGTKAWDK